LRNIPRTRDGLKRRWRVERLPVLSVGLIGAYHAIS